MIVRQLADFLEAMNTAPIEAPSPPTDPDLAPSVVRLLTALTLITIGCVILMHPIYNFVAWFCFVAIPWETRGQRRAFPIVLWLLFVLAVASKNAGWLVLSHFFEHPIFRATLWMVVSGVYLRQWIRLRNAFGSSPAAVPQE